eukprot:CAMPEP_0184692482 /NCGR_PEP_ID=MMETSP0313-20130426/945_1 /TAXON_ID=2792 /ORGANISM="Porphyridium aerugineum, Strain SAG 1380-2" /LENGTH=614 /DNA_ID=CAMNT_0027150317 /DNA_START=188 /DNA_END=2032 /DNA_ORIENTATION=+
MEINIKSSTGSKFSITVNDNTETIEAFKKRVHAQCGIEPEYQRLIYRGHVLKDTQTFEELTKTGLENGHTMHLVRSGAAAAAGAGAGTAAGTGAATAATNGLGPAVPNASAPRAVAPTVTPTPTASTTFPNAFGAAAPQPSPFGMGTANPFGAFPGFGASPGAGGNMDLNAMQQQLMQNPEMMRQMMDSPMMQSMLSNPELVRSMMMMNPQVRQLMETNPELAHVLNDPNNIRQAIEMARNPAMMNEMTRNMDRAMANIEMMPGGFDALRRMHENVQQPLTEAMMQPPPANNEENPFSNLFATTNTPSTAPMPNPWNPAGAGNANGVGANANTNINTASRAPSTATGATQATAATAADPFSSLFGTPATNVNANTNSNLNNFGYNPMGTGGFGGMMPPNQEEMLRLMEDPFMQQMMQSMLSNPATRQQLVSSNPMLRQAIETNPQMAQMLDNPDFLRMMTNPEILRQSINLQQAMQQAGVGPGFGYPGYGTTPSTTSANPPVAPTGAQPADAGATPSTGSNADLSQLFNMFALSQAARGAPAGGNLFVPPATGAAPAPAPAMTQEQLEQMYATQLSQLRDMGFLDTTMCIQALQASGGNVNLAVERLLNQFGGR